MQNTVSYLLCSDIFVFMKYDQLKMDLCTELSAGGWLNFWLDEIGPL